MENVSNFLKACRSVGVAEHSLFETVDLYEGKDLGLVVRCLVRLAVDERASWAAQSSSEPSIGSCVAAVAVSGTLCC